MTNQLKIYSSKKYLLKLIIFSAIILLIGANCFKSSFLILKIIGVLNCLIGTSGLIISLFYLFNKKPQLILSEAGIQPQKLTGEIIPWENFSEVEIVKKNNQRTLLLKSKTKLHEKNFKFLYRKTAKSDLKNNVIRVDLNSLNIEDSELQLFLSQKDHLKK